MKERKVGTIEHPYINWKDTRTMIIRGFNSKDTALELYVTLPSDKLRRLDTLSCAIRQLKSLFTEIKGQIEDTIEAEETFARGW